MGWQLSAGPDWPVPLFCQYIQACINAQKILFQPVFLLFLSAGKHREFRPCHHGVRPEATRHLWGQRSVWECQPHSGPVHTHRSGWNGEGSGAHTFTYVGISLKSPLAAHYYLILILFFFCLDFHGNSMDLIKAMWVWKVHSYYHHFSFLSPPLLSGQVQRFPLEVRYRREVRRETAAALRSREAQGGT